MSQLVSSNHFLFSSLQQPSQQSLSLYIPFQSFSVVCLTHSLEAFTSYNFAPVAL